MASTTEPRGQRNWFLLSWLALIVLYNLFTIVSFLTGGNNPLQYQLPPDTVPQPSPLILLVVLSAAAAIIACVAIALGYRAGWYGLVASYVVMTAASLGVGFNIGTVLLAGLVFLVTWALIRPQWSQMK
jgi:hypothetical protein